ncbi:MAG: hypothetical protein QOE25_909 [Actinomycetota bacterium]|nr:hypothetical protein [Actinomycetota bacterium]
MDRRRKIVRTVNAVARKVKRGPGADSLAVARRTWGRADSHHLLVRNPVFLFSSVRSGSTLLRVMLDTHSEIVAPHEMHFRSVRVRFAGRETLKAFGELQLGTQTLENMLWDRVFAHLLAQAGKSVVVDKTPSNTMAWRRISEWWPDARYLFLLRHPVHIADSLIASRPKTPVANHYKRVNSYVAAIHEASTALPGLQVRYEELTAEPERELKRICAWLGVAWEPAMLDYATKERSYTRGLGDWSATLQSGEIRPPRPLPDRADIPTELLESCGLLGYL